jgi:DNA-binding PadR family transcriptional regulator
MDDLSAFLPLSPATLHILLALVDQGRHGYGIVREVERQSEGRYKLGPGTLYDNLEKLMDRGLVEIAPRPRGDDARRKSYYRLSGFGRRVLAAEMARLEKLLRRARPHLRPATGGNS